MAVAYDTWAQLMQPTQRRRHMAMAFDAWTQLMQPTPRL